MREKEEREKEKDWEKIAKVSLFFPWNCSSCINCTCKRNKRNREKLGGERRGERKQKKGRERNNEKDKETYFASLRLFLMDK